MSLNAVLQHCKGVLNGLSIVLPNQTVQLTAAVQPNPVVPLGGPFAAVWCEHGGAKQGSFPRTQAFQVFQWQIDVYLHYETTANVNIRPGVDQEFPLISSAVIKAFHADPINVMITDPTTGEESQLNAIGDDVKWTSPFEKTTGNQTTVYYVARYTTTAEEWVAGQ